MQVLLNSRPRSQRLKAYLKSLPLQKRKEALLLMQQDGINIASLKFYMYNGEIPKFMAEDIEYCLGISIF